MSEQAAKVLLDLQKEAQGEGNSSKASFGAISGGYFGLGLKAALEAFADNVEASQKIIAELFGVSAFLGKLQREIAEAYRDIIAGPGKDSDSSKIQAVLDSSRSSQEKADLLNALTAQFQVHQTESGQWNSYIGGLNNNANSVASQVSNSSANSIASMQGAVEVAITVITKLRG